MDSIHSKGEVQQQQNDSSTTLGKNRRETLTHNSIGLQRRWRYNDRADGC